MIMYARTASPAHPAGSAAVMRNGLRLMVLGLCSGLAACGGGNGDGSGDAAAVPATYTSWVDNSLDTFILDWDSDRFARRDGDGRLVYFRADGTTVALTDMSITEDRRIMLNGNEIGFIGGATSHRVRYPVPARLVCTDGRLLDIQMTSDAYRSACTGNVVYGILPPMS